MPEKIQKYFNELGAPKKKEIEMEKLLSLKNAHSSERILLAFEYVRKNGVLGSGSLCHSPFSYLSVAIGEVLAEVDRVNARKSRVSEGEYTRTKWKQEGEEKAEETEKEYKARESAFLEAFPSEKAREKYFEDYCTRIPGVPKNSVC